MSIVMKEERRNMLVEVLSHVLTRLCELNDRCVITHPAVTRFQAITAPHVTIKSYLKRIVKYSNCSEQCFVLALIYIDRLNRINEGFKVNSLNVHRLIITSIMLGAKFFDDKYYNNAYFGKVGGVTCKEINLLEIEFVFMINFNLYVESGLYEDYKKRLENHAQRLNCVGYQLQNQSTEIKESVFVPRVATSLQTAVERTQEFKKPAKKWSALTVSPSLREPLLDNNQKVVRSKSRAPKSVVNRVKPRCTPLSPNFLKTLRRLQMKTK